MLTYDQKYAQKAYEHVTAIKDGKDEKAKKSYGSMSHKLPILIYKAGLVQALTFVEARGKEVQKQLLDDLAKSIDAENKVNLLQLARGAKLSEYIYLTQQVLAALLWYKRFAQSILGIDASDVDDEEGKE
jgi:CRISPR-associated protein Cmr5